MMKPTRTLMLKKRRSYFTMLAHRHMLKLWSTVYSFGPEMDHSFDIGREVWMTRLDNVEGEAQAGRLIQSETHQYDADYQSQRIGDNRSSPMYTPLELMEKIPKLAPGELPFYSARLLVAYDADKRCYRELVAPFWWKNLPGDDGLTQNTAKYHRDITGKNDHYIEPTFDHMHHGVTNEARFEPATPEEAAEIEAEEKYERDIRNSMQQSVADLGMIEVPPYYIIGQRTWNSIMPWYKAKKAKGTLTAQEDGSPDWDLLMSWKDVPQSEPTAVKAA
eukprot:TRINITY_DN6968_c0_g1_i1.p1 TRINITY_DN6968_c0_g1~~TRINITY_DN6968_c0_g1_i1.p1  ORF type:complete len:318 (+),score=44.05 TRINITY_DN6968_c0_g1_i1:129-956(+)